MANPNSLPCILFLRAVNVGGSNIIKMKDLCQKFEESGYFSAVKSYLQSGNVVVNISSESLLSKTLEESNNSGDDKKQQQKVIVDIEKLTQTVNTLIRTHFHCEPVVIVRQIHDIENVLEKIPFPYEEPNKVQVHFLDQIANSEGKTALENYDKGPEIVKVFDREVYVHYVEGIGRSKFSRVPLEKMLKANATARNLNTIRSVLKIAREMNDTE